MRSFRAAAASEGGLNLERSVPLGGGGAAGGKAPSAERCPGNAICFVFEFRIGSSSILSIRYYMQRTTIRPTRHLRFRSRARSAGSSKINISNKFIKLSTVVTTAEQSFVRSQ